MSRKESTIRTAAELTNSYVAGTVLTTPDDDNQLIVLVDFTIGSLTSAEVKVEFSNDGTNYYQEAAEETASGSGTTTIYPIEYKFTATGTYRLAIPVKEQFIKLSAKGTGTVTSSSMTIESVNGQA